MMKPRFCLKSFILDESGQTTTEYILILAILVTIILQFKDRLGQYIEKLFGRIDESGDRIFE